MAEDFTPVTIRQLQFNGRVPGPRGQATGFVSYKASESDGDIHVRLIDPNGDPNDWLVCEIIPELPMPNGVPPLHSTITVRGILRWDIEHGWPELHPMLSWTAGTATA